MQYLHGGRHASSRVRHRKCLFQLHFEKSKAARVIRYRVVPTAGPAMSAVLHHAAARPPCPYTPPDNLQVGTRQRPLQRLGLVPWLTASFELDAAPEILDGSLVFLPVRDKGAEPQTVSVALDGRKPLAKIARIRRRPSHPRHRG
jgi:hypothetical protein